MDEGTSGVEICWDVCKTIVDVSITSTFEVMICVTRTGASGVVLFGAVSNGADDTHRHREKRVMR